MTLTTWIKEHRLSQRLLVTFLATRLERLTEQIVCSVSNHSRQASNGPTSLNPSLEGIVELSYRLQHLRDLTLGIHKLSRVYTPLFFARSLLKFAPCADGEGLSNNGGLLPQQGLNLDPTLFPYGNTEPQP